MKFTCWCLGLGWFCLVLGGGALYLELKATQRKLYYEVDGNIIIHRHGPTQGMWVKGSRCWMSVITSQDVIPKSLKDALPYVQVWLKDDPIPYAMTMQGGELMLQVPCTPFGGPTIVRMKEIVEMIDEKMKARPPLKLPQGPIAGID